MSTLLTGLFPDLLWQGGQFRSNLALLMSESEILSVASREDIEREVDQRREKGEYISTRSLPERALLPGLVNTHSHAFQRGIRGRTEFPESAEENDQSFWSWRELMYQAAQRLEPLELEALSQAVYVEMVKSGITRVGEFHYVHHQADGNPYPNPDETAERIFRAAQSAGIKVTLLRSFYQRAGVGRPEPEGAQKLFCDPNVDFYLETLDRLRAADRDIGVTAHSVRAVTKEGLQQLIAYAQEHELPFHIHASEQQKEIDECLAEHKLRPIQLLAELDGLHQKSNLVHAIHLTPDEIELIGQAQCTICSCPTTERNLGDGVVPAAKLLQAGAKFSFGTDSQCQISLWEDARQLEYHLRLRDQGRSRLYAEQKAASAAFIDMLTQNGSVSLGAKKKSRLEPGGSSDVIALDLEHLSLVGASPESLALDLVFSAPPGVVSDVWIDGAEIVADGYHRAESQARQNLRRVMKRLRG